MRQKGQSADSGEVKETVEQWLKRPRKKERDKVQVAFFGGSFTGLPLPKQKELLGTVRPYIVAGLVDSIRISTRPDYIDDTIITLLKDYCVSTVELGVQSLDKRVLDVNARGHSAQQSVTAIRQLKQSGFSVGVQLMCGLPGDSTARLMKTTKRVAELAPHFVRIYPALVIKGSGLEQLYLDGKYAFLPLAKAVALCCRMKTVFEEHNIKVIRMGLQPSEEFAEKVVAGPYHPSFGELVVSRCLFNKARKVLYKSKKTQAKRLSIAAADESAFRGQNNVNMKRLAALGLLKNTELVFDSEQARNSVLLCGQAKG